MTQSAPKSPSRTKRQGLRFPMFLKFWIGCSTLAALLIIGGLLVVRNETKKSRRPYFLKQHFRRYVSYQEASGRSLGAIADLLAIDAELVSTLSGPRVDPEGVAGPPTAADAAGIAKRFFDGLSGNGSIQPDLFVIVSQSGLVWRNSAAIFEEADLRELEPVARVRAGQAFFNKVLVHAGKAVQLAGVPIRGPDGSVIGGVLVGIDLTSFLQAYQQLSEEDAKMQHRLTLIHEGQVVASSFPRDTWSELATQLKEDSWVQVQDGDTKRPVVHLAGDSYDFHHGAIDGFAGLEAGKVGDLFLLRPHSASTDTAAQMPWLELLTGAVLSLLIASALALWITRPIKRFVEQSRQMLEGGAGLNQRIELSSRDELADLADNINQVFARLYALASNVQSAAFQVGASSAQIGAASRQMLEGLRDQTFKIESSTAAVTELSASIQQVANNAVEATKVAEKSNVAVTAAVARMQKIRATVEDAASKMGELGDSSKRIGNIVEVIRQISEQTSLLALNASIEAAHAGEQGRGFAVVADEVSSLARRVGQSAKDIEALIQTVKEQTADAVQSMQRGTSEVENGTELVTNTLQDLGVLIATVNDTAAAVQEQAEVSDEIARNMDAVQKIATELVSGSEEAVEQGDQLHTLAFELERSVGGFNLDPGSSSPSSKARAALSDGK